MKSVILGTVLTVLISFFYTDISYAKYVGICNGEKIIDSQDKSLQIPKGATIHSRIIRGQNITVLCPSTKLAPPINHSPIWFATPDQFGFTGQGIQFSVAATDPDGQDLSYKISNLPEGAIFDTTTRVFTWVPDSSQFGKHALKFLASDGSLHDEMSVTIFIYPSYVAHYYQFPNMLKFFDFSPLILAEEGKLYISTLQVSGGSNLFYRIIEGPKGLYIDEQYGILSWIPDNTQGRSDPYLITIGVSNGKAEVAKSFYVKVEDKK